MERTSVVFEPNVKVNVPPVVSSFPAVPSAYYSYMGPQENRISVLNSMGTEEEQQESLRIWYSMRSKTLFPLKTSYAETREEQLQYPPPPSSIALSIKDRLRQIPETTDWFFIDIYGYIVAQRKDPSMGDFLELFYQFPCNPSADPPEVARLLKEYIESSGDEEPIRKYLADRGVKHLENHNLRYYPILELFFLLTRYASFPFTEYQLRLLEKRGETTFGSPAEIFIDAVFYKTDLETGLVLEVLNQIQTQGPGEAGKRWSTSDPHWVEWADEYLVTRERIPIENFSVSLYDLSDQLYTWTDFQINELLLKLRIPPPFRQEYPARYAYISSLAGTIKRYRADPAETARWREQTQPNLLGMGSV